METRITAAVAKKLGYRTLTQLAQSIGVDKQNYKNLVFVSDNGKNTMLFLKKNGDYKAIG